MPVLSDMTIRLSSPEDAGAVRRLSALDSRRPPVEPLLLAEIDGVLHAAVAVADGDAVADPFRPTAEIVELLRLRAHGLRGDVPRPTGPTWLPGRLRRTSPV